MTRMIGPDKGAVSVEIGGKEHKRHKDGTFHVDPSAAKALRKTGDFAVVGTVFRTSGFTCSACGFQAVFSDSCGRCGGSEMIANA